ncbi:MAG TPA: hypothetical protein ENN19_09250 [Chloroflexi bacterium]|nr:hypothetical protein [Chloroflexota bacterium]
MELSKRRLLIILPLWGILVLLVGTCCGVRERQGGLLAPFPSAEAPTQLPDLTAFTTTGAESTPSPSPSPSPSPVPSPGYVASTPLPQTTFTLTILYTGEIYGEILPCPG